MPKAFVSGEWRGLRVKVQGMLQEHGYEHCFPSYPEGKYRELLSTFVGMLAVMDEADLLVAMPEDQFEIGYMCGKHKSIIVYDDMTKRPEGMNFRRIHGPATFVVGSLEALDVVLKEFAPVAGALSPVDSKFAKVVSELKAKLKPQYSEAAKFKK